MSVRGLTCPVLYLLLLSLGATACSRSSDKEPSIQQGNGQLPLDPSASNAGKNPSDTKKQPDLEGGVAQIDSSGIIGWAWDRNEPNTPLRVDVYDGNDLIATILANVHRDGLVKAGKGNGAHGFEYRFPAPQRDNREHVITVRYAGTDQAIKGSPKALRLEPLIVPKKATDQDKTNDKKSSASKGNG